MSMETQKILRFIPIINMITMFCWIGLCFKKSIRQLDYFKSLLKMFAYLLLITVVRIAISFIFKNEFLDQIVFYISIYFYFFSISWVSVQAQEKILSAEKK